jgi:flagellar motor switch protein FliG
MSRNVAIRKAAILVALLDTETADVLLAQMPPDQADKVLRESRKLGKIDPAEQRAVIDEFFRIGPLVPEDDPPGLDLEGAVFNSTAAPIDEYVSADAEPGWVVENAPRIASETQAIYASPFTKINSGASIKSIDPKTPFSFLHDADADALAPLLEREHPQAIALVLAHLSPDRAGQLLSRLPAKLQSDVVRRLIDLEETDRDVLRDVEQAVENWLEKRASSRPRVAGIPAVSAILNASDEQSRRHILNNLAAHNRPLANTLNPPPPPPKPYAFADLCELSDEVFTRIVRAVDHRTAVLALAGATEEIVQRLLDHLDPDEADQFSDDLTHLGSLRLIDIDRAQDDLARLANQLRAQGRLTATRHAHSTATA